MPIPKGHLPAGGIGPLTAQTTEVRFSAAPGFSISYHEKNKLIQRFALERRLKRLSKSASAPRTGTLAKELALKDREEIAAEEAAVHSPDATVTCRLPEAPPSG